jgi:type VI protein secretion system component Hcp
VTVTRNTDFVSPQLLQASLQNRAFSAVEVVLSAGRAQRYELKNVRLSSFQQSGGGGGAAMESMSLGFEDLHMEGPSGTTKPGAEEKTGGSAGSILVDGLRDPAKAMPIDAMSWGTVSPGSSGGGKTTGRTLVQDVTITKSMDDTSSAFLHAMRTNKRLPKAVITSTDAARDGTPQGTLDLRNVIVTSVQHGVGQGAKENVSLSFETFELTQNAGRPAQEDLRAPAKLTVVADVGGKPIESPVRTWSWGASRATDGNGGPSGEPESSARGVRRASFQDLSLQVPSGPAVSHLLQALQSNAVLPGTTLKVTGGLTYDLREARVTSLQLAMTEGRDLAQVSLTYVRFSESAGASSMEARPQGDL